MPDTTPTVPGATPPACPRARSAMTPCFVTDGPVAQAEDGACVGCGHQFPTPAERDAGLWVPVAKKYVQKQPISDADYARIMAADERRKRRAAKRLNLPTAPSEGGETTDHG